MREDKMGKQEVTIKEGSAVYYYTPEGDTIPTTVLKVSISKRRKRVQLARTRIDQEINNSGRRGWVPLSRIELQ